MKNANKIKFWTVIIILIAGGSGLVASATISPFIFKLIKSMNTFVTVDALISIYIGIPFIISCGVGFMLFLLADKFLKV